MNCKKSVQIHPATTILGHTLVTLRNNGRYEGAQVHPAFLTGAQRGPLNQGVSTIKWNPKATIWKHSAFD